jgi:hypothetical protein
MDTEKLRWSSYMLSSFKFALANLRSVLELNYFPRAEKVRRLQAADLTINFPTLVFFKDRKAKFLTRRSKTARGQTR